MSSGGGRHGMNVHRTCVQREQAHRRWEPEPIPELVPEKPNVLRRVAETLRGAWKATPSLKARKKNSNG